MQTKESQVFRGSFLLDPSSFLLPPSLFLSSLCLCVSVVNPLHARRRPLGIDEARHESIGWLTDQFLERILLHDAAFLHQHQVVAEEARFAEVVRHQDDRLVQRLEDMLEVGLQLGADEWIESTERFIKQQQTGVEHQGAHEADTLPLTAGQLHGIVAEAVVRETGQLGQLLETLADAARVPAEVAGHEGDVAACGQVREQAAVLHDETDAAAGRGGVVRRERSAVEEHRPRVRLDEARHEADERGFAATAGADEHGRPAGQDGQVNLTHCGCAAVGLRDAEELEHALMVRLAGPSRKRQGQDTLVGSP